MYQLVDSAVQIVEALKKPAPKTVKYRGNRICDASMVWNLQANLFEAMFGIEIERKGGGHAPFEDEFRYAASFYQRMQKAIMEGADAVRDYVPRAPQLYCSADGLSEDDLRKIEHDRAEICPEGALAVALPDIATIVICPLTYQLQDTKLLPRGKVREGDAIDSVRYVSFGAVLVHEL